MLPPRRARTLNTRCNVQAIKLYHLSSKARMSSWPLAGIWRRLASTPLWLFLRLRRLYRQLFPQAPRVKERRDVIICYARRYSAWVRGKSTKTANGRRTKPAETWQTPERGIACNRSAKSERIGAGQSISALARSDVV